MKHMMGGLLGFARQVLFSGRVFWERELLVICMPIYNISRIFMAEQNNLKMDICLGQYCKLKQYSERTSDYD